MSEPEPEKPQGRLAIRAEKMAANQAAAEARAAVRAAAADGGDGGGSSGAGVGVGVGGPVFIGGSPNFEMVDSVRVDMNRETVAALAAAANPYAGIDLLMAMGGRIFNLANTVPADLEAEVKAAVNGAVEAATTSLASEPNRSLAQNLIDVAGPHPDEGLMNCNALADGW